MDNNTNINITINKENLNDSSSDSSNDVNDNINDINDYDSNNSEDELITRFTRKPQSKFITRIGEALFYNKRFLEDLNVYTENRLNFIFQSYIDKIKIILAPIFSMTDFITDILTLVVYYQQDDIGWFSFGLTLLCIASISTTSLALMQNKHFSKIIDNNRFVNYRYKKNNKLVSRDDVNKILNSDPENKLIIVEPPNEDTDCEDNGDIEGAGIGTLDENTDTKINDNEVYLDENLNPIIWKKVLKIPYFYLYAFIGIIGLSPLLLTLSFLKSKEKMSYNNSPISLLKFIETLIESIPQLILQVYVLGIIQTSENYLFGKDLFITSISISFSIISIFIGINMKDNNIGIATLEIIYFIGWLGRFVVFGTAYRAWVLLLFMCELFLIGGILQYLLRCFNILDDNHNHAPFKQIIMNSRSTNIRIISVINSIIMTTIVYSFSLPNTGFSYQKIHLCENNVGCFSYGFIWILSSIIGLYILIVLILEFYIKFIKNNEEEREQINPKEIVNLLGPNTIMVDDETQT